MKSLRTFLSSLQQSSQKSAKTVVGIDIGSSAVKVVELQDRAGIITLTTYGELQLGPYLHKEIGQSVQLEPASEQSALVDVIRESVVKAREAVFAMPLSASYITNIAFNAPPEEDIAPRVRVEARKVIPMSLSEVALDWAEITSFEEGTRTILVAAIQNDALKRYKLLMQFVNINEPPTEIECFSTIRGVNKDQEGHVAVIDIGATTMKMYLVKQGVLIRMYRARAGGAIATKRIAAILEIDFGAAEARKRALAPEDAHFIDIQRAHYAAYERTLVEFRQVIAEHERVTKDTVTKVFLSGGGVLFPGMQKIIADAFGKEVVVAEPFSKVAYPAFMEDAMKHIGPPFATAMGAALRAFE